MSEEEQPKKKLPKQPEFPPNIGFIHLRNKEAGPRGGITIAFEKVFDPINPKKVTVVAMAAAKCHHKDNFNRRTGRIKAGNRLKSARYREEMDPGMALDDFLKNSHEAFRETAPLLKQLFKE